MLILVSVSSFIFGILVASFLYERAIRKINVHLDDILKNMEV